MKVGLGMMMIFIPKYGMGWGWRQGKDVRMGPGFGAKSPRAPIAIPS